MLTLQNPSDGPDLAMT